MELISKAKKIGQNFLKKIAKIFSDKSSIVPEFEPRGEPIISPTQLQSSASDNQPSTRPIPAYMVAAAQGKAEWDEDNPATQQQFIGQVYLAKRTAFKTEEPALLVRTLHSNPPHPPYHQGGAPYPEIHPSPSSNLNETRTHMPREQSSNSNNLAFQARLIMASNNFVTQQNTVQQSVTRLTSSSPITIPTRDSSLPNELCPVVNLPESSLSNTRTRRPSSRKTSSSRIG